MPRSFRVHEKRQDFLREFGIRATARSLDLPQKVFRIQLSAFNDRNLYQL
jgi:hypothetical protein